jgi:hypothetical protein
MRHLQRLRRARWPTPSPTPPSLWSPASHISPHWRTPRSSIGSSTITCSNVSAPLMTANGIELTQRGIGEFHLGFRTRNVHHQGARCVIDRIRKQRGHANASAPARRKFRGERMYDPRRHTDDKTDVKAAPIGGRSSSRIFVGGQQKWSCCRQAFHLNGPIAGEESRAIVISDQSFNNRYVPVPHAMIEDLGVNCDVADVLGRVVLIDPQCSRDPHAESVCRQIMREKAGAG